MASELKTVSAAVATQYPVQVILAPLASAQETAQRILKQAKGEKLKPVMVFNVTAVGPVAAVDAAKAQVLALGYSIRSANLTPSKTVLVYVTGK